MEAGGSPAVAVTGGEESRKDLMVLGDEESLPDPKTYARRYQLEALEMAMRENTIVFLETGSGKTLIAVMLLRAYAHLLRKPSPFIAVFLVPTVVLVNQQASVVEMHTDLNVGRFWGEMGVDFWDAAIWAEKLQQFEVFVMTPQILLDNLRHTFFKLDCIKLLIFDECHHARGRSPYACIMKEFYHRQLLTNSFDLPRIFGMTASLINSKGSSSQFTYSKKIEELESLMNSKVYTVTSESVLSQHISFPTLKIKQYKHLDIPHGLFICLADHLKSLETKHIRAIEEQMLDPSSAESARKNISKLHDTFLFCLTELGVWLAAKAVESLSCKENYIPFWGQRIDGTCESAVKMFSEDVFRVLSQYLPEGRCIGDDFNADINAGLLTTKVQSLVQSLLQYRGVPDLRCIIFVQRVITAIVLQSCLSSISQLSGWGTRYMAGKSFVWQSQTRKEQMEIIDEFHKGKVNVIVATQILEEGLDVQSCNLVIRFDPSATVCSFIQSRGRARKQSSDYVLIVRSDDMHMLSKVNNFLKSGDMMREESLRHTSLPCKPLESDMYDEEFYRVERTGAVVTLSSSVALIHFYCSRLPSDRYFKPHPRFVINKECHTCILYLPKNCPIQTVHAMGRSDLLKQIVCLEACKKLHEICALNDLLLPVFDVEDEDVVLGSGMESYCDQQANYFPGELVDSWLSFCGLGMYHCYQITLDKTFSYDASFSDIILVVKCDLGPDFMSYSFNLESDKGSVSVGLKHVDVVHLSHNQVLLAKQFQISILSVLLHHDYIKLMDALNCLHNQESSTTVAYLLLPSIGKRIDWHCVKSASFTIDKVKNIKHCFSSRGVCRWIQTKNGPVHSCMLHKSVVYTPHSGHFYCITGSLDARDGNSVLNLKGGQALTYKEYYQKKYGISLTYGNEFLLAGRHLFKVQNFLLRRSVLKEKEINNSDVQLPPELCEVIMSPISVNALYSFSFAPSIMHRIQCMLLAARLKTVHLDHCMQNVIIPATKVLEAITTKKCLEKFSLESLETLGDSFLKYVASQHLFKAYVHHHEGILSAKKDKLVSNPVLCQLACHHNLPRLEFLGDAILDYLVTVHLFNKYPDMTPGLLTDLRSASVNNDCYAHAAVKAGLNKHILHASSELHKQMSFYLNNFSESFSGSSYGWDAGAALPKVLGDVIESIAGAIYVDSGFDKDIVWSSIRPLLEPLVTPETIKYNPLRELNELCIRRNYKKVYSSTSLDGAASITAEVEANGAVYKETRTGLNKKTAKKLAAKAVLKLLKSKIFDL